MLACSVCFSTNRCYRCITCCHGPAACLREGGANGYKLVIICFQERQQLENLLKKVKTQNDKVRRCLVLLIDFILIGRQPSSLRVSVHRLLRVRKPQMKPN